MIRYFQNNEEAALRAKEIVDNGFKLDKKNAQFVAPAKFDKTKNGYKITTITKIPGQKARTHRVTCNMEDGYEGNFNKANVSVDCDCIAGDSLVLTDKGWQTIYSIAGDWNPGDSLDINYIVNGKSYPGSVPFYKGLQYVSKLELANGFELRATKDHKILVSTFDTNKGYKNIWKPLDKIEIGDQVVITNNVNLLPEKSRSRRFKEAYFIGFWYGDGSFCSSILPDLQIPQNHRKQEVLPRIFDLGIVEDVSNFLKKDTEITRIKFNIKAIELLQKYNITKYSRNVIPEKILNDKELLLGFLSGLLDSDGRLNSSNGMDISGSHELKNLQKALIRFGISSVRFKVGSKTGDKTNYGSRTRDLCHLVLSANAFRDLDDRLWLVRYPKYIKKRLQGPTRSKVINKSFSGKTHVYDIHVPEIHRFVANSVIVHNCARYLYVWNYALQQYNAAIKDRTNGEPPVETNPSQQPGICKHGQVALRMLLRMNPYWQAPKNKSTSSMKAIPLTSLDQILKRIKKNRV